MATYLRYLASNETAYSEYFTWRDSGGVFWGGAHAALYCRLCALAHHTLGTRNATDNILSVFVSDMKPAFYTLKGRA